jgi:hypothetical protein
MLCLRFFSWVPQRVSPAAVPGFFLHARGQEMYIVIRRLPDAKRPLYSGTNPDLCARFLVCGAVSPIHGMALNPYKL